MHSLKNVFFFLFVSVLLSTVSFCAGRETNTRITDIRFWQSPEEAQIVIDVTSPPKVSPVSRLSNGTLYFDISKCDFRPGRQRYPLQNAFLEVLTVHKIDKGMVRVFFRAPDGVEGKTFVLPKNETKGNRIVIFLREPKVQATKRRTAELTEINRLKTENIKIVVLDPGHGGEDPGTRNNGIIEKQYVMTMGKLIKAYFERDPRFKVILTRNGDYIIPLQRRREIAEYLGADAFVSLHANYNPKKSIRGSEVYYESPRGAVTEAERLVAEFENQADFAGSINVSSNASVKTAKKEIIEKQATVMNMSRQLAEHIELNLGKSVTTMPSRGVKRAGFKVLHSMAMPSVLVEFGYTSNNLDAAILKNYNARTRMAQAVYFGVRDFLLNPVDRGADKDYLSYIRVVESQRKAAEIRKQKAAREKVRARGRAIRYKVKAGNTLSGIASRHRVSLRSILTLNKISIRHIIKVGEIILIPRK